MQNQLELRQFRGTSWCAACSWAALAALVAACSSSSATGSGGPSTSGGSGNSAGQTSANGGSISNGGSNGVAGSANGGATASGGSTTSGGSSASGGSGGDSTAMLGNYKTVEVYQSSRNAGLGSAPEHFATLSALTPHASATSTRTVVNVDATQLRQSIIGFGAALTEVAASTVSVLPADSQKQIYDAYFSADSGSGYTLTRTHIGSCDFALKEYTYDDTAGDTTLSKFSIDNDQKYLIPALKQASQSSGGALKVLASLWSAPAWMKSNNSLYDGTLTTANYGLFAQYLSKYLQAYKAAGVPIWALTPTNEPLGVGGSRESMVWTAAQMNTFLRDSLAPQLTKDGVSVDTFIFDHNKDTTTSDAVSWAHTIIGDASTGKSIAGTAVHWYGSTFQVYESELDALHAVDPTKQILFDEGTADGFIFNTSTVQVQSAPWFKHDDWYWTKDDYDWGYIYDNRAIHPAYAPVYRYARDIIVGLNHWYAGWIDWNAVLNKFGALDATHGGIGAVGSPGVSHIANGVPAGIMVDEASPSSPDIYYSPIFYAMRHFSKYIRPGAKIATTTLTLAGSVMKIDYDGTPTQDGQALLAVSALNTDGSIAVVLFNETKAAIDYSVTVGTQAADGSIPAQSLQTLVWK